MRWQSTSCEAWTSVMEVSSGEATRAAAAMRARGGSDSGEAAHCLTADTSPLKMMPCR